MIGMRSIIQHTTKYDGTIHYRFPAEVVAESEEALALYRKPGVPFESYRDNRIGENHMLILFYQNRYHNVEIAWKADWEPAMHYLNIASPAEWDRVVVTAVDLDLDLIRRATGEILIDDEDEFELHIERFHYPKELIDRCRSELERLHIAMQERRGILSDQIFDWRPAGTVHESLLTAV
jgi:protein associated with RNAse G/E